MCVYVTHVNAVCVCVCQRAFTCVTHAFTCVALTCVTYTHSVCGRVRESMCDVYADVYTVTYTHIFSHFV